LLLQGVAQGLLGAGVAVLVLFGVHRILQPLMEPLAALTFGLPHVAFLSGAAVAGLLAAGALLGGLGGLVAKGRA
jgi:hypothetical protein